MSDISMLEGIKVLVVDDEPDILEVLEELLDMCHVTTASTFEQAKTLLETQAFDIAILDIMGVDGYSLLEIANKKKIPAIMLTAHAFSADNLVRTIKEGAYAYVPKEEISRITEFLSDALNAQKKGENPWHVWEERLPSSYFEKRWGAAWKNSDRDFWNKFRESIKTRDSKKREV
jgi:DNA-binding NtrC family response regulator